jgi:hypothetical protein
VLTNMVMRRRCYLEGESWLILTHTSSSTRVVFQTMVVYQAKFFASKPDVYQVGLIPKRTSTEVPLYIYIYIWRTRGGVQGNPDVGIRNVTHNLWRSLHDTYRWQYANIRIDLERYKPRWVGKALRLNESRIQDQRCG